jgi:hypothetical protein
MLRVGIGFKLAQSIISAAAMNRWSGCGLVRHWMHNRSSFPAGWAHIFKRPISHSQFGQDLIVLSLTHALNKGIQEPFSYIDLAANDARRGSNTYLLDACFGWTGICVEPNQMYGAGIVATRSCALTEKCVSNNSREVEFMNNFYLGHIVTRNLQNVIMRCTTLQNVLDHHSTPPFFKVSNPAPKARISYLSLDIEGHELQALQGVDWNRTTIDIISIENAGLEHIRYLSNFGHVPTMCAGIDMIFVRHQLLDATLLWYAENRAQLHPLCVQADISKCKLGSGSANFFDCSLKVGFWNSWQ